MIVETNDEVPKGWIEASFEDLELE